MRKRTLVVGTCAAAVALAGGATYALGGGSGIWDDGKIVQPGSLDDGKNLLPQTKVSLADAVAKAQQAADGALGQVDLKQRADGVFYVVDVGSEEVSVDAVTGNVAGIGPQT
jgi:uncharacterized membrane protein YkoI